MLGSLIYCGLLRWPPFRRLLPILIDLCDVTLSFLSCLHTMIARKAFLVFP